MAEATAGATPGAGVLYLGGAGRASSELLAAAENARRYWDAVLPTLRPVNSPDDKHGGRGR